MPEINEFKPVVPLETSAENFQAELLEKTNAILKELKSFFTLKKLPEFKPEYKWLKDKKITIVDDGEIILQNQIPELLVATNGKASYILHKEESAEELAEKIIKENPEIVLMDYGLTKEIKGTKVIESLKKAKFSGKIVGYSSDRDSNEELMESGAIGAIDKSAINEKYGVDSVRLLGELIKNLEEKQQE